MDTNSQNAAYTVRLPKWEQILYALAKCQDVSSLVLDNLRVIRHKIRYNISTS